MSLTFPQTPGGTLTELWLACLRLVQQLEPKVIKDRTIGTTSTAVAHGLGYVPTLAIPIPHIDARVWREAAPDERFIYFAASGSVVCDFLVIP